MRRARARRARRAFRRVRARVRARGALGARGRAAARVPSGGAPVAPGALVAIVAALVVVAARVVVAACANNHDDRPRTDDERAEETSVSRPGVAGLRRSRSPNTRRSKHRTTHRRTTDRRTCGTAEIARVRLLLLHRSERGRRPPSDAARIGPDGASSLRVPLGSGTTGRRSPRRSPTTSSTTRRSRSSPRGTRSPTRSRGAARGPGTTAARPPILSWRSSVPAGLAACSSGARA